jgi:BirA family biotin operon repressor/biotin-[acetyl-CoA-carboxylase] ligase
VAGAGVNLNLTSDDFPLDLRDIATSVWLERGGRTVSREDFAIHFLRSLGAQFLRAEKDFPALLADCGSRSFLNGKRVTLVSGGETLEGTVYGTGPEGELRLVHADGRTELITSADFVRLAADPA